MKNNQIKVSVFVPVFNDDKNIEECINSLLYQTFSFDEILIVNDCSTDNTDKILKKFSNIKIINNKINKGISYTRNIAIKNCKNEIIAGIDSDVVLNKNWLHLMLENFLKNNAVYSCGNIEEKFIQNKFNLWRSQRYPLNWGQKDIKNPPFIFTNNTLQYKYVWSQTGGFEAKYSKPGGDDIIYSNKVNNLFKDKIYYFSNVKSYHLADDNLFTLSNRVWRYHSYGYKIKNPTTFRFIKLVTKQFNFLLKRVYQDVFKFKFLSINIMVFLLFIKYEFQRTFLNK